MLATPISGWRKRPGTPFQCLAALLWMTVMIMVQSLVAQTNVTTADLRHWADLRLAEARIRLGTSSNQLELRLKLAKAIFDRAEYAKDDDEREALANEGIAVARQLAATNPNLAGAHHYLGMNMGQLARTKLFGALSLVNQMESAFKTAKGLDATFDDAGPDRCLGLLYRDAPGWPTSIGNRSKAREHLRAAAELRPNHPENRLNLLESAFIWNDRALAVLEYRALLQLMPAMPDTFPGEDCCPTDWIGRNAGQRRGNGFEIHLATLNHPATRSDSRRIDDLGANSLSESMHLAILVCGLALLGVGCAKTAPPTAPKSGLTGSPSPTEPIMSPAKTVAGRVSSVNNAARFVVLSYSFGFLPATDQRLNVYRQGQKVGEVKVSGPQQDTNTVADLISGNLQIGDEARPD